MFVLFGEVAVSGIASTRINIFGLIINIRARRSIDYEHDPQDHRHHSVCLIHRHVHLRHNDVCGGDAAIEFLIFGNDFRAKLKFREGSIVGGQLELSEGYETLNADRPLEIKGTLKNLNIDRWLTILADFPELGASESFFDPNIRFGGASIIAENLVAGGVSFANTKIGITRNLDSWTGHFENERLIGQLELWEKKSKPILPSVAGQNSSSPEKELSRLAQEGLVNRINDFIKKA